MIDFLICVKARISIHNKEKLRKRAFFVANIRAPMRQNGGKDDYAASKRNP